MSQLISFETLKKRREETQSFNRWKDYYLQQSHEDLLEALVYEHEHNFPLRSSPEKIDQLRHQALIEALSDRAQTQFLKTLLNEIRGSGR